MNTGKTASMRIAAIDAIEQLMREDERVVVISADSIAVFRAEGLLERFPHRVFEAGIAEQSAVLMAAGMASAGMIPFITAYSGFTVMRACEQMRTFVGYPSLNVKLIGANAGISAGNREGVTHQFFEDLGIMRTIPCISVIAPADAAQSAKAVVAAYGIDGPVYIRSGASADPVIYEEEAPFDFGKADILVNEGEDVLLIGCGSMLKNMLEAAVALKVLGKAVTLINVSTIKPLDAALIKWIDRCKVVVTAEDHTIIGGLGSAVCELACTHSPKRIVRLGVRDCYAESGFPDELLSKYHLGVRDIIDAALGVVDNASSSVGEYRDSVYVKGVNGR